MSIDAIVSYDDTDNDLDALALGRLLADVGAQLTLVYVRHATQLEHTREEAEAHHADALLERGAQRLEAHHVAQRVVVSPSTGEGLKSLAEQEDAELVVFGSDYRTAIGHVTPGRSAQTLLDRCPAAVALAPAGFHIEDEPRVAKIGILAGGDDDAALTTARALADAFGASLTTDQRGIDLLVVGSRPEAAEGRVMVTAHARNVIENATCPVLVLARGRVLSFSSNLATA